MNKRSDLIYVYVRIVASIKMENIHHGTSFNKQLWVMYRRRPLLIVAVDIGAAIVAAPFTCVKHVSYYVLFSNYNFKLKICL